MTVVKPAEPADAEAIAELAEEMDRFYGATEFDPREIRVRQINEAIFSGPPSAYVLLAWTDDGHLVGFASYSYLWPAVGLTRSLFLKELYVSESARRQGIGKQLMHALYEVAAKQECSRVEWMTDKPNTDAQRFYEEQIGVSPDFTKLFYRVNHDRSEGDTPMAAPPGTALGHEPLTAARTREVLAAAGHLDLVSLDGERADQTYVLEHRGSGWLVFFLERGVKQDFRKHTSEDAACRDLLARLPR